MSAAQGDEEFMSRRPNEDSEEISAGDMWTTQNIRKLLTLRLERDGLFNRPKNRSILWRQISEELLKQNVCATPTQCAQKFRNLLTTYRNNKQKVRSTGEGVKWVFYEQIVTFRPSALSYFVRKFKF
uniref:Trihelix transcription factor GT-4 n=1 Tax=Cacopsylla melanoneura TaxID=428564 RepID=A0A8D8TKG3_9HEMI